MRRLEPSPPDDVTENGREDIRYTSSTVGGQLGVETVLACFVRKSTVRPLDDREDSCTRNDSHILISFTGSLVSCCQNDTGS